MGPESEISGSLKNLMPEKIGLWAKFNWRIPYLVGSWGDGLITYHSASSRKKCKYRAVKALQGLLCHRISKYAGPWTCGGYVFVSYVRLILSQFDLGLSPLANNIFICFWNEQGALCIFFLLISLPPYNDILKNMSNCPLEHNPKPPVEQGAVNKVNIGLPLRLIMMTSAQWNWNECPRGYLAWAWEHCAHA